jgi:hypothetical protein
MSQSEPQDSFAKRMALNFVSGGLGAILTFVLGLITLQHAPASVKDAVSKTTRWVPLEQLEEVNTKLKAAQDEIELLKAPTVNPPPPKVIDTCAGDAKDILWGDTARELGFAGHTDQEYVLRCPADGAAVGTIYGTKTYIMESPISVAGLHAAAIKSAKDGGVVKIVMDGGREHLRGSVQNGVQSLPWNDWHPSNYHFVSCATGKPL